MMSDSCPYIGQTAIVTWDAADRKWIGRRGVVVEGHYSSIVGWAITVEFGTPEHHSSTRRSFPMSGLDLIPRHSAE